MVSVLDIATQQVSFGYHEVISELPDTLSDPVELKGTDDNKFYMELLKFIDKHKENLINNDVERRQTRNILTKATILEEIGLEIKDYISKLWLGIRNHLDVADTREFNCVSFSEAPAESIFLFGSVLQLEKFHLHWHILMLCCLYPKKSLKLVQIKL